MSSFNLTTSWSVEPEPSVEQSAEEVSPQTTIIEDFVDGRVEKSSILRKLREDVDRLQKDTLWYELLVDQCRSALEEDKSAISARMNRMDKSLKDLRRNVENSRCSHSEEDYNSEALMAKFKLTMESGVSLLKRVLSQKPSHESWEGYLDRLASRYTPAAPKHRSPSPQPEVSLVHSAGQTTTRQPPMPSPSISVSDCQSVSESTPVSYLQEPLGIHDIAESFELELDPTSTPLSLAGAPANPFLSLFHEIHRASRRQTALPLLGTRYRSSSTSRSASLAPVQSLYRHKPYPPLDPPLPRSASDVSFMLDVSLTLNRSLEVLSVAQVPVTSRLLCFPGSTSDGGVAQSQNNTKDSDARDPDSDPGDSNTRDSDPGNSNTRDSDSGDFNTRDSNPGDSNTDPRDSDTRGSETKPIKYLVYNRITMRHGFELLSSTLRGAIKLIEVGDIYLRMWSDLGSVHAGVVLHRIQAIHPCLARLVPVIISSLLSIHTATLLYACLLYIREAIVMATEMDPELTIA
ncbi:hypothetical protein EDB85DRAFT_417328 [Lactarius pseudohatsudake]|nr:hypothetical protein EDB85DRAFT_417328 [Lactarius pseudohatsudake]